MKIAILFDTPISVYNGVFKAMVNWTVGLKGDLFILNNTSVSHFLRKRNIRYRVIGDLKNISSMLEGYDCVFYDDVSKRLLKAMEEVPIFKIVYVYPVFGLRPMGGLSISNYQSIKTRTMVRASRNIPYRFFIRNYVKDLRLADLTITQSFTSAGILRYYHGIIPDAILPNPVDRTVFKPVKESEKIPNKILLFLGSGDGDVDIALLKQLDSFFHESDLNLYVFGYKGALKFIKKSNYQILDSVTDAELSYHMATSLYSLIIQEDEPLSYVSMESISSGTPVIASYPEESIINGITGYYASKKNYLNMIKFALSSGIDTNTDLFRKASEDFDMNPLSEKLIKLIEEHINGNRGKEI